ncbi:FCD domain-containing protein [Paenarthrobacter ureafaciens]|uniref:FCD domain-containing protein n=2 Tax=Micrococcaceae TaxID=1268 RepID=UPI002264C396|nr:FCD domain-containing protein [Paenarthrobacter ureafaciens]MCX8454325.1 FCD domain-containing protein [Paenarthrobacter ureafaciens]MCY0972530.1 FCD domain-containing protein [Paenarthrobacter ureafaciens]
MRYGSTLDSCNDYKAAGVNISLGTDSFPPDLIRGIDAGVQLAKILAGRNDAGDLTGYVDAATLGGARALGRNDLGRLQPGAQADMVAFSLDDIRDGVHDDPLRTLTLNGSARQAILSVVAGRTIMADGLIEGVDPDYWRTRGQELFDKMRAGYTQRDTPEAACGRAVSTRVCSVGALTGAVRRTRLGAGMKGSSTVAEAGPENGNVRDDEARAEYVYQLVLEGIVSGSFAQGSRLRERELSDMYSVSRIPVREAIQRLEQDGFVATFPRRGAVVRQLTLTDVNELFDVRLCLETFAAREAAARVAEGGDGGRLGELMEASKAAIDEDRTDDVVLISAELHAEIVRLSGNRLLMESVKPLFGRMRWIFGLAHNRSNELQREEHTQLCNAILNGRPELAYSLAYSHIELGREPVLAGLAETLEP